ADRFDVRHVGDPVQDDMAAGFGKPFGGGKAQALRGAGHEHGLTGDHMERPMNNLTMVVDHGMIVAWTRWRCPNSRLRAWPSSIAFAGRAGRCGSHASANRSPTSSRRSAFRTSRRGSERCAAAV